MSIISRTGDLFYAFRFLKLLTTPWNKTDAFENGIVDENGKVLKKSRELSSDEKSSYTVFHRLVFNIKRLLGKLPFGKTKLASYAAALFLIKEHTQMNDDEVITILEKVVGENIDKNLFMVESMYFEKDNQLCPGVYTVNKDLVSPITGEVVAPVKTKIVVEQFVQAYGQFADVNVYELEHYGQKIYISGQDIER